MDVTNLRNQSVVLANINNNQLDNSLTVANL